MRICMIAYTVYDVDSRVVRYAETLARRGDYVEVLALRRPGQPRHSEINGVHLYRIQVRTYEERSKFNFLFRILRFLLHSMILFSFRHLKERFHVAHVHSVPDFLVFAALVPKLTGCRVVLDIHDLLPEFYASKFDSDFDSPFVRLLLVVEKVSAAFADHVIIANHLWYEKLILRALPERKCTVFLNYPDRRLFSPGGRTRHDDKFIVLFPGSVNWHQGLDVAVRAFRRVREQAPQAEFHIYGHGSEWNALDQMIRDLDAAGYVFLHEPRPVDEIARLIENADLGIVPKRKDTFGNEAFSTKILEFMTLGIPVVVADTAIDRHYFNASVVQFFRSGDEEDLAEAILRLVHHPEIRQQLAHNALQCVKEYDWESKSKEYLGLVDSLAHPQPAH